MEAAFADGLVIRTRSRIMSIALLVADWLRKLRVRESRMVAAALPGDGGDGLGNDGIVWLVDTVEVDHLTALGGENGARKAMETSTGVVHPGILRVEERWGAAREGIRNFPADKNRNLHSQGRSAAIAACCNFESFVCAGRPWISFKNSHLVGASMGGI